MGPSQRNCALLLAVVAAVCVELYQAYPFGRCSCINSAKNVRGNISDFILYEKNPRCNKRELIVTITRPDNSTIKLCLSTEAEKAKDLIQCWESINKDKSRRMECIDKKKAEERTSEETST